MKSMLTPKQHTEILQLKSMVETLADRYNQRVGDEEYTGIALLALCKAVHNYNPTRGVPLENYVRMTVFNHLNTAYSRETYDRKHRNYFFPPYYPDTYAHDLIDLLPVRLQQIAFARWIDGDGLGKIAKDEGLTYKQVRTRLAEAETFACLYLNGGAA